MVLLLTVGGSEIGLFLSSIVGRLDLRHCSELRTHHLLHLHAAAAIQQSNWWYLSSDEQNPVSDNLDPYLICGTAPYSPRHLQNLKANQTAPRRRRHLIPYYYVLYNGNTGGYCTTLI